MTPAPSSSQTLPAQPAEGSPLYRIIVLTALGVGIGAVVSLAAIGFLEAVQWLNDATLISPRQRVQHSMTPWLVAGATVFVPTIGGLAVGLLLTRLSPEKRPLGPPDVISAIQLRARPPSFRGGLVSTLAAILSLGCGASVGQYGPMVYLGAMLGERAAHPRLRIRNLSPIVMACGVAGAIATAFNAPVAGLVFAHEVVLRHYSMQAFAPTTVAAATGYVMANVVFERPPLFLVEFGGVAHGHEFALFALVGIVAAAIAVIFMKLVLKAGQTARNLPFDPALRPALAGLAVGVTALWLPDVLGVGKEALRFATIEGAFYTWELALLIIAKVVLSALCIGFGFAGGVFSPVILIGILTGALFWTGLDQFFGVENSGLAVYAICGMMALASPVIGAPLTTIIIVFELTRNYDLSIAAMVAVVFANLIAYRVFGRSLFDVQLAGKGMDLSSGRDRALLQDTPLTRYGRTDFLRIGESDMIAGLDAALRSSPWREAFVTNREGVLSGVIYAEDIDGMSDRTALQALHPPEALFSDSTLWDAVRDLDRFTRDCIPIVEPQSRRLIAVVTKSDIISAFLETVHDLRREENAAG